MFRSALQIILILVIGSTMFTACKKDDTATPHGPATIEGKWVGKYGYDNDDPVYYYCFNVKADGTIQELNSSQKVLGSGTWELNGDVFTSTVTWNPPYHSTFITTATFDANNGKLTGIWGYDPSDSDGGTWFMDKQD